MALAISIVRASSGHARVFAWPCAGGAVRHGGRVGYVPAAEAATFRADRRALKCFVHRRAGAIGRWSREPAAARGAGRASARVPLCPVEPVELRGGRPGSCGPHASASRTLNLRVHRGGGYVEVSALAYARDRDIERSVREKRPWIDAKLAQVAASPAAVAAEAGPEEVAAWRAVVEVKCAPRWNGGVEPIMGVKAGKLAYR